MLTVKAVGMSVVGVTLTCVQEDCRDYHQKSDAT